MNLDDFTVCKHDRATVIGTVKGRAPNSGKRQLACVARMFNIVQLFSESVGSQLDLLKSVLLLTGKTIYVSEIA